MPTYGLPNSSTSSGALTDYYNATHLPSKRTQSNPANQYGSAGGTLYGGVPYQQTTGGYNQTHSAIQGGVQNMGTQGQRIQDAYNYQAPPFQSPGNNFANPGYTEQAFEYMQNRLLNDPSQQYMVNAGNQMLNPSTGEQYMNQNLGSLDGPGMGEQYWNQVSGQFMDPFAGEQFARQATQNFAAQGPASAFYNQAMGNYDAYTGYNTQNAQNQYGQSSAALANGTAGEQGLGQLAGQYGAIGQYQGGNNALGQYQQNANYGPMAAQSFYDSVSGQYNQLGQYSGPNLSAGQYAQTQQAFGDLPIANFDPYYDRAIQLGTQDYNRQAAGRGVYGSSEALSGVGNIVADLNAERANRSFDAEMQRAVEQRNRQQLLGQQAQMGDQSSLAAFSANLQGLNTFGNLANQAGNQTLAQQEMLGNQARNADLTGLDAFKANLQGVDTFANVNNMLGNQELGRHELLGSMANNADSQATAAQNARTSALNAFGSIASNADSAETNRYTATTNAMNNADRTALDRLGLGADIAFRGDDSRRSDYEASMGAANNAANLQQDRLRTGADIMSTMSQNDLRRLESTMNAASIAENDRQGRNQTAWDMTRQNTNDVHSAISGGLEGIIGGSQQDFEQNWQAQMLPMLQQSGMDQKDIDNLYNAFAAIMKSKGGG